MCKTGKRVAMGKAYRVERKVMMVVIDLHPEDVAEASWHPSIGPENLISTV